MTVVGTTTPVALHTDRYELTMLDAAVRSGTVDRPCVFETFTRRLPPGRRFGVAAGLGRLVEAVTAFRFDDAALAFLDDTDVVAPVTLRWLAGFRFRGDIHAYREGEVYVPGSPVLTITAPFGESVVLETLALSILNHDSAVAAAAARMVQAAGGRPLMEFGSRRTHEEAALAAARAAYLTGFAGTSNLAAGLRHGIPTLGTSAHAFTLLFDAEETAFRAQVAAFGPSTTLLVDTYDISAGIDRALAAAGPQLGAIRIDSGDLRAEAERARAQLDAAGAHDTHIVVSGDLDEFRIAELSTAPIDGYGVGTSVVVGSGAPTAGFVYKLVARAERPGEPFVPVAKAGGGKATVGGRKVAARRLQDGVAVAEVLRDATKPPGAHDRPLQVPVVVDGEVVHTPSLDEIRSHHRAAVEELPAEARLLSPAEPPLTLVWDMQPDSGPLAGDPQPQGRP